MFRHYIGQLKLILLIFDITAFAAAYSTAYWVRHGNLRPFPSAYVWGGIFFLLLMIVLFQRLGLYKMNLGCLDEGIGAAKGIFSAFFVILGISFFYREVSYSRIVVLLLGPLVLTFTILGRILFRKLSKDFSQIERIKRNTLIIGCGVIGKYLLDELLLHHSIYRPVGFLDDNSSIKEYKGIPSLGTLKEIDQIIKQYDIVNVFMGIPTAPREIIQDVIQRCKKYNVQYGVIPDLYSLKIENVHLDVFGNLPIIAPKDTNILGMNFLIKRLFDFVLSTSFLIVISPLMLVIAIAVKLSSHGPVFYRQKRVGMNGKIFTFLKFRSMFVEKEDHIHREYAAKWIQNNESHHNDRKGKAIFKIERDTRVTSIGRFLRRFSLDELPQFLNVWKGDMSLVGPRPPLPYEVEIYKDWHKRRLHAPPGITGLWQVSGRNKLSFDEMLRLDLSYIANWSLENDIKIILKTIPTVLFGKAY